jgi:uncharacterized protein (DUF2235 family)
VKALRIVQIIILLALVAYLFLMNNYNPQWLPYLFTLCFSRGYRFSRGLAGRLDLRAKRKLEQEQRTLET